MSASASVPQLPLPSADGCRKHGSCARGQRKTRQIKTYAKDPVLLKQYRMAIKNNLIEKRGQVDKDKIVYRAKRGTPVPVTPKKVEQASFNPLEDDDADKDDDQEETYHESDSQKEYKIACRNLKVPVCQKAYRGLAEQSLSIPYQNITAAGIKAMAYGLLHNTKLETVNLCSNDMGTEGALCIAKVLEENFFLVSLNLSDNDIGTEGIACICEVLKYNRAVHHIDLSGNKIGDPGATLIEEMLGDNATLKALILSNNEIEEQGGVYLAQALERNDTLQEIDLSWNHLRGEGAVAIGDALAQNTGLQKVDLSWNGFAKDGTRAVGQALIVNTTITHLNMSSNRITCAYLSGLLDGLAENTTLTTLLLGQNSFTYQGANKLLETIIGNPDLPIFSIDLKNQEVDMTFMELLQKVRDTRQLYMAHGVIMKEGLEVNTKDDFAHMDPMMALLECIEQKRLRLVDLFVKIDRDGSRKLNHQEFKDGLTSLNIPMSLKAVNRLIRKLDKDNDGEVDFAEIMVGQRDYIAQKESSQNPKGPNMNKLQTKVSKLLRSQKAEAMSRLFETSEAQFKLVMQRSAERQSKEKKGKDTSQAAGPSSGETNTAEGNKEEGSKFMDDDAGRTERVANIALEAVKLMMSGARKQSKLRLVVARAKELEAKKKAEEQAQLEEEAAQEAETL